MKNSIVVFDSGLGGLNIFNTLKNKYPNENYIYVADEKYLPYGTKPIDFLKKRISLIVDYFKDAKAFIIACNTASSVYALLNKDYKNVYEIIQVTSEYAAKKSINKKIGVIATNLTIDLGKYQDYLEKLNTSIYPLKYSELVDIVESKNNLTIDEFERSVNESLKEKLKVFNNTNIDTLICGCTHFGYLIEYYKKYLGNINYIVSDDAVVEFIENKLELNKVKDPQIKIYTTGDVLVFEDKMKAYNIEGRVEQLNI